MHDFEPSVSDERSERRWRGLFWVTIVACLVLLGTLIPSPYIVEKPGPTVDVLASMTLKGEEPRPVIEVDGTKLYEGEGSLRLLTVSISGSREHPKGWLTLLPAVFDPSQAIKPVDEFFPEGVTEKQRNKQNVALMEDSQEQAAAAAFEYLGRDVPVTLTVARIGEQSPAAGVLQEGDVLTRVNGVTDFDFAQLREQIALNGVDRPLQLAVQRGGKDVELALTPVLPEGGTEPMIGVVLQTAYDLPYDVDIALADIGGPSAGMVFALGLIDRLTPGSLLAGQDVAGTGTIDMSGNVGPIGGLEQKMWAASQAGSTLFLMPMANCGDLPENIAGGLQVAPVQNLQEAVTAIETAAAGKTPRGVEACSAPS